MGRPQTVLSPRVERASVADAHSYSVLQYTQTYRWRRSDGDSICSASNAVQPEWTPARMNQILLEKTGSPTVTTMHHIPAVQGTGAAPVGRAGRVRGTQSDVALDVDSAPELQLWNSLNERPVLLYGSRIQFSLQYCTHPFLDNLH